MWRRNLTNETSFGREPITIVEIDQDFCSLIYGSSPCTAAVGVTGTKKCFNTLRTCQDTTNFDKSSLTLKFCTPTSNMPKGENLIPSLMGVTTRPTEINILGGDPNKQALGRRASVTVTFQDHPYSDRLVDKYISDRSYNPNTQGTFWSKWVQRNPYYQNRPIRIREGYIGQDISSMRTRHYVIDQIDGPDSSGKVTLTAKDILKLADDKKAKCPVATTGFLSSDFSEDATQFQLSPTGIGDEEYPASGIVLINEELVNFTRSGDIFTVVQRAMRNTEIADHERDDTVQLVKVFTNMRVDAIIKELLEDFAGIDIAFVPYTDWQDEADDWFSGYNLNAYITEPTGVNQLVAELAEQCGFYIWWDEIDQEIKFRADKPFDPRISIPILTDSDSVIADSVKITEEVNQRISEIDFYFDIINPTVDLEEISNYRKLRVKIDTDAESETQYNEKRIREIFSRWFTDSNDGEVLTTSQRMLTRYRDNPKFITFMADAKTRLDIWTGDVFILRHRGVVDDEGNVIDFFAQVISVVEKSSGHMLEYKCQAFTYTGRYAYVVANGTDTYDNLTDDEKLFGGWIAPNTGVFTDNGEAYKII